MNPKRQVLLQSVFNIQPGEGKQVAVMFLYSLCTVGGVYIIGRAISRSLFLSSLPQEAIAYRFILPPAILILVTTLYARLARRYSLSQLIIGSNGLLIAGVLLFRLLLASPYGQSFPVLAGLFIFVEVIALLVGTQFWTFAGQVFDPRQAKRLFGLIGAGGTIANVIAGAGLSLAATVLGPENLIFVLALSLAGCMACVWSLGRDRAPVRESAAKADPVGPPKRRSTLQDIKSLGQSPLLVLTSGISVLLVIVATVADYQFDLALKANFGGDGQQISAFLGSFFFWAGLAGCLVQFFVTSRVLTRFGVTSALLFSPTAYALGAASILITGGTLWAAALSRASDVIFRYTLNEAALNLFYLPIPASLRNQAKTLIYGLIIPPVISLLGVIFLFVPRLKGWTIVHWSIPMLLLVLLWVGLIFKARREYIRSLTLNLQKSRLSLAELHLELSDETSVHALREALQHPDELQVLSALQLVSEAPQVDWVPDLRRLLDHPSPEVRVTTLNLLARWGSQEAAPALLRQIQAPEEAVRAAAIAAYCACNKEEALVQLRPLLQESSPTLKRAVVVGLIKYGGLEGVLPAVESLKTMLVSDQAEMRRETAHALESLQVHTFYQPLLPLLEDPCREVQIAAIQAAGAVGAPPLIPPLLQKLGQPATYRAALEALAGWDTALDPVLAQTLADSEREQNLRRRIPQVLQRRGTPQAATILLGHLQESDRVVRGAVFAALTRLRAAGIPFEIDPARIREALMLEFGYYYEVYVWRADLNGDSNGPESLLTEALRVRLEERLDRIFFLLELLYSVPLIAAIRAALKVKAGPQRANAIELLDNLVDRDIKTFLLPLIEATPEQVFEIARQRFQISRCPAPARLEALAHYPDPWLQSCATFQISKVATGGLETTMSLSTMEKILFLKSIRLFNQIPSEYLAGVAQIAHPVQFEPGETFIKQGEQGDCLYVVVEGEGQVVLEGAGPVSQIQARSIIGEMAILSDEPRSATCLATTALMALKIERNDFWALMEERPEIALGVVKMLVHNLNTLNHKVQSQQQAQTVEQYLNNLDD